MRIAFVTHRYPPSVGGVEYVVQSLSKTLSLLGHEVSVFTMDQIPSLPVHELIDRVMVNRYKGIVGNPYFVPGPLMTMKLFQRWQEYDVVHVHNIHSLLMLICCLICRKGPGRKLFVTAYYHGETASRFRNMLWCFYRPVLRVILKTVDGVFAVSRSEASLIKRDFGLEAVVAENGVDADVMACKWNPEPGCILYAGRIEQYKNIELAAAMTIGLQKLGYKAGLHVVGNGSHLKTLKSNVAKMGLKAEFSSFLSRKEYLEQLCSASLLVNLSSFESYPQSVNEAQAIGVPVVIAEPWGWNFSSRPRTKVLKHGEFGSNSVLHEIGQLMDNAAFEARAQVPSWDEVVNHRIVRVYEGKSTWLTVRT